MEETRPSLSDREIINTRRTGAEPFFNVPVPLQGEGGFAPPSDSGGDGSAPPTDSPPIAEDLAVPKGLKIKSQTARMSPTGEQIVDVVLQFSEVADASNYEVRLSIQ